MTIEGYDKSYAQSYALANNIKFEIIKPVSPIVPNNPAKIEDNKNNTIISNIITQKEYGIVAYKDKTAVGAKTGDNLFVFNQIMLIIMISSGLYVLCNKRYKEKKYRLNGKYLPNKSNRNIKE